MFLFFAFNDSVLGFAQGLLKTKPLNAVGAIQKAQIRSNQSQSPLLSAGLSRSTSQIIIHLAAGCDREHPWHLAMKPDSFKAFTLDQLAGLGPIRCRFMFGGYGLNLEDTFFATSYQGRVYFKTTDKTQVAYLREGGEPIHPNATQTLRSYHEVPVRVLEDAATLEHWAAEVAATGS
jgi:DNA transformation protein and related proteins